MRYLLLVALNLPIILLAFINIITHYKLRRISSNRFRHQVILWLVILTVLVGSFPLYNLISGSPVFDSRELSLFDIVEITALVLLFYIANDQRQKIERSEKAFRELHQELSIAMRK